MTQLGPFLKLYWPLALFLVFLVPAVRRHWIMAIILVCAAVLRFFNLDHSLGIHPDERHMIMVAEKLSLENLNPKSFAYGSFPYYLLWLTSRAASVFSDYPVSYEGLFIVGRVLCVLFGLGGILLAYMISKRLYGQGAAGIIAAALLAFNVFHLQLSRFYTVDVILTTICTAGLLCMLSIGRDGKAGSFVLAGICMGLAVGSKISALFLLAPLGIASLVNLVRKRHRLHPAVFALPILSVVIAAITFIAVEPYAVLDYETFSAHSREQTSMVRGEWRPPYTIQYAHTTPYLYHLKQMLLYTMGWPVALVVFAAVGLTVLRQFRRLNADELIVLAYILPMFALVAGFQVKFPRYLLPLYPPLFVFAGAALAGFAAWFQRNGAGAAAGAAFSPGSVRFSAAESFAPDWFTRALADERVMRWGKRLAAALLIIGIGYASVRGVMYLAAGSSPTIFVGGRGSSSGYFDHMQDIAVGADGSIYAVDMYNHRVQKFDPNGAFVLSWGEKGEAPGEFNEPRGIAVDNSGRIFVMDTWNNRVQKFDADGKFLRQWRDDRGFYGAKGIAVWGGKVFVTDSGNGRVVITDDEGAAITSFGRKGRAPGEFQEPSGIAVSGNGVVYVVDSANNRVQRFSQDGNFISAWQVEGWNDGNLKEAFIEIDGAGQVYLADPVGGGVLRYSAEGQFIERLAAGASSPCGLALSNQKVLLGDRAEGRVVPIG